MSFSLKQICISPAASINEAVRVLNEGHKRIVFVVDSKRKLLGVIADSDIRRAILKHISLTDSVSRIMVKSPRIATTSMKEETILAMMKRTKIYELPLVDAKGILVGLRTIDEYLHFSSLANALIFAGGLGTRLHPITQKTPKPLIKIADKSILFRIMDDLLELGIDRISLALNYKAKLIEKAVKKQQVYRNKVHCIQETMRLGTAGALSLIDRPQVPLIVLNGDILTKVDFKSMLHFHLSERNLITVGLREEKMQIPFGVLSVKGTRVTKVEEKPSLSFYINAGIYIISPNVINLVPKKTYLDMPQLIEKVIARNDRVGSFPIHEYWIDVGRHSQLIQARDEFKKIL